MTKIQQIENDAYMILCDIAFLFGTNNGKKCIYAFNLKNIKQKALFQVRGSDLLLYQSNMSKENTYKSMIIVERNKQKMIEDLEKCQNIQNKK